MRIEWTCVKERGRRIVLKLFCLSLHFRGIIYLWARRVPQGFPALNNNEHETTNLTRVHLRKALFTRNAGTKCRASITQSSLGDGQNVMRRLGGYVFSAPHGLHNEL